MNKAAYTLPRYKRLARFTVIGGASTAVHFLSVITLVAGFHLSPLVANVIAFLIAFSVSYFGHSRWTFSDFENARNKSTLPRFFITAVFSFILNETFFAYLLHVQHMHYTLALAIVLASVSVVTYMISKYWAFR